MAASADLYGSADVEADGPIPGSYSMLSFGLAVVSAVPSPMARRTLFGVDG